MPRSASPSSPSSPSSRGSGASRTSRLRVVGAALAAAGLVVGTLAGCGSTRTTTAASTHVVGVSEQDCGSDWHPTAGVRQAVTVRNASSVAGEIQVVGAGTHAGLVYDGIDNLAPGSTVTLHTALTPGRYALRCLMEDEPSATGPAVTITGHGTGVRGIAAVTDADLITVTQRYQRWVSAHLPALVRAVGRLSASIGTPAAARRAWLTAHLDYVRLGGAYGAFGDLAQRIDGLPDASPAAATGWTGFHRVEDDLWRRASPARTGRDVQVLLGDLRALRRLWAGTELDPGELTIRAHEISENALEFAANGSDDDGSHSDPATIGASMQATAVVLRILAPVLDARIPVAPLLGEVAAVQRRADRLRDAGTRGSRRQREALAASLSRLCERLAPVAATLEPRRTTS